MKRQCRKLNYPICDLDEHLFALNKNLLIEIDTVKRSRKFYENFLPALQVWCGKSSMKNKWNRFIKITPPSYSLIYIEIQLSPRDSISSMEPFLEHIEACGCEYESTTDDSKCYKRIFNYKYDGITVCLQINFKTSLFCSVKEIKKMKEVIEREIQCKYY